MKKLLFLFAALFIFRAVLAQAQDRVNFSESETFRIIHYLASDDMRGRKAFSPDIDRAAAFISKEFKKAGLKPFQGKSYLQNFFMYSAIRKRLTASFGHQPVDSNSVLVIGNGSENIVVNQNSGYAISKVDAGQNVFSVVKTLVENGDNNLVLIDTSFGKYFSRLNYFNRNFFVRKGNTVLVLGQPDLTEFQISVQFDMQKKRLRNVVGILPGSSREKEYVIFSAHYDHLGVGEPDGKGDSIYNGANDDASGTTAVIELAKYFKKKKDNARTLIFAAFTAEEIGGFGSRYFGRRLLPDSIVAMFNIEMIGTESKWGKNSAYITGYEKTDMGKILRRNLEGSDFHFYPDPYPEQNLFYRSDNATLALLGVPAHTISTSKMDAEPNYHRLSDEVNTLDLKNMTEIIKSIALSAESIVSGHDTPTRVQPGTLHE